MTSMLHNRSMTRGRDLFGRKAPLYDRDEIEHMRRACRIAAQTLDYITPYVVPGVSTAELDDLIHRYMLSENAVPATLGYRGYPASSCISPNHVVNHGIPSAETILRDGDVTNIDVTVIVDGWFGDTSRMYFVGDSVAAPARHLCDVTHEAMMLGIDQIAPGRHLGDIGWAIRKLCERHGYSSVVEYGGHGIGLSFHDAPIVVHWADRPRTGLILEPGMIFTVEPMLNAGSRDIKTLSDGWTTVTKDKSLSCQFEHTVVVTEAGYDILTLSPVGYGKPPYGTSRAARPPAD